MDQTLISYGRITSDIKNVKLRRILSRARRETVACIFVDNNVHNDYWDNNSGKRHHRDHTDYFDYTEHDATGRN